jgi:putative nucleotidyltransferase with HDIG domain
MSIRLRLSLFITGLIVLIMGSSYWLMRQGMNDAMTDLSRSELTLLAGSIRSNIVNMMNQGADMNALDRSYTVLQKEHPEILDLRVMHGPAVDRQFGQHANEMPRDDLDRQGLASTQALIVQRKENAREVLRFVYPLIASQVCLQCHEAKDGEELGAMSLSLDVTRWGEKASEKLRQLLQINMIELMLLLLGLWLILDRLVFAKLDGLRAGAERITGGDFSQPVPNESDSEIGVVIRAFNDMAERILSYRKEQEAIIGEQAHEMVHLVETTNLLGALADLHDILDRFARSLAESAQVTWCRIGLLDQESTLVIKAQYPQHPLPQLGELPHSFEEATCPLVWQLIRKREPRIVYANDSITDEERRLIFADRETASLCLPIVHKEATLGLVILSEFRSQQRDPIDDRKVYLSRAMVNLIGAAIEVSRLFDQLIGQSQDAVMAMAESVEKKSPWTAGHSKRVTGYALAIAGEMGWSGKQLEELRITGLLHDIGKIGVPGTILNKAGRLTEEEYAIVKRHPEDGGQILSKMRTFRALVPAVRHHHEWFNGNGYPDGLRGKEIPIAARILAVADAFDAMTADRPYRKGLTREEAMRRLEDAAGEQFDPEVVAVFKRCYKKV